MAIQGFEASDVRYSHGYDGSKVMMIMGQNGILKTRTSVLAHFFFSHRLFLWIFVISLACPLNIANSTTLLDTLIGFQPQQKLV